MRCLAVLATTGWLAVRLRVVWATLFRVLLGTLALPFLIMDKVEKA
jgi:hypothetical protein